MFLKRLASAFFATLRIVLPALVVFIVLLYFMQPGMLFLPDVPGREPVTTPENIGLAYERVTIPTEDGESLDAWYIPAPDARHTVLFFHGNAGNISHRLDSIRLFRELGVNQLIFDYRGYGRSTGAPDEEGLYRDARAAWDYLVTVRGVAPDRVLLFGRSLGAAVAIQLATRVLPAAVIVESGFTSVPDIGSEIYPWLPVRALSRYRFDSLRRIRTLRVPVLVIHSRSDKIIPFHHGLALFEAASEPKQMLVIDGGHNDGFLRSKGKYVEALRDFLRTRVSS